MNIFVTSPCPIECARALDDKRVNKMLLESVQILSTVMHLTGLGENAPYRPTHGRHPCTLWAMESKANYKWLWQHADALFEEYKRRSGKESHGCERALRACMWGGLGLPDIPLTPFVNCTSYKDVGDVYMAYQLTLNDKWEADKRPPTWGGERR